MPGWTLDILSQGFSHSVLSQCKREPWDLLRQGWGRGSGGDLPNAISPCARSHWDPQQNNEHNTSGGLGMLPFPFPFPFFNGGFPSLFFSLFILGICRIYVGICNLCSSLYVEQNRKRHKSWVRLSVKCLAVGRNRPVLVCSPVPIPSAAPPFRGEHRPFLPVLQHGPGWPKCRLTSAKIQLRNLDA